MHNYQRLDVWRLSRDLATACYQVTATFPKSETFGLAQQIRRSSVSIASNLAEGAGRGSPADFRRFVRIASGSACELETQCLIALDVDLVGRDEAQGMLQTIRRIKNMLFALEASLTRRQASTSRHT